MNKETQQRIVDTIKANGKQFCHTYEYNGLYMYENPYCTTVYFIDKDNNDDLIMLFDIWRKEV